LNFRVADVGAVDEADEVEDSEDGKNFEVEFAEDALFVGFLGGMLSIFMVGVGCERG
jgi:hypothetical protein